MTNQEISETILEIDQAADTILATIATAAPGLAPPAQVAQLIADLALKAIAAWFAASGIEPTPENLMLLYPNPTPLSPPTV